MKTNPYRTLGVNRSATPEEIKAAHRRLVLAHHPDRGGDKDAFAEIQTAYDLLSDPEKRREFDKRSDEKPITKLSQTVRDIVDEFWASATSTNKDTHA